MQGREIWIVKLRGCDSLNESELLRGQTLLVSSTDKPELEDEDDFLVQVCHIAFLSSSLKQQQAGFPSNVVPESSGFNSTSGPVTLNCAGENLHHQNTSLLGLTVPFNPALLLASVTTHSRAGCELAGLDKQ